MKRYAVYIIIISYHFAYAYRKRHSYEVQFLRYEVRHNFFSFQAVFCSFARLLTPKIKIWKKIQKARGDIILLHMCTINQGHRYVWCMVPEIWSFWDGTFLSLWEIFCPFISAPLPSPFLPPNNPQNKNLRENEKNTLRYHHLTQLYQKSWSYTILFLRYRAWCMLFPFTPPSPLTSPKMKNSKQWKKPGDINLH